MGSTNMRLKRGLNIQWARRLIEDDGHWIKMLVKDLKWMEWKDLDHMME